VLADESKEVRDTARWLLWHYGGDRATSSLLDGNWRSFYLSLDSWERRIYKQLRQPPYRYMIIRTLNLQSNKVSYFSSTPKVEPLWLEPTTRDVVLTVSSTFEKRQFCPGKDITPQEKLLLESGTEEGELLLESIRKRAELVLGYTTQKTKFLRCLLAGNCRSIQRRGFLTVVAALLNGWMNLGNLKGIEIGSCYPFGWYRQVNLCKIFVHNTYPLLAAYPDLEVLHIRGWLQPNIPLFKPKLEMPKIARENQTVDFETQLIEHSKLKTLIIEVHQIENSHLAQISSLRCDLLEYLEIWLSDKLDEKAMLRNIAPILSGKSFPHVTCLRLLWSQTGDALAEAIARSPLINRLRVLDLSFGNLSDRGALALLECPATNYLRTLDISCTKVSEQMISRLSKLQCRVISVDMDY
jgi:hypothetical protein